MFAADFKLMIRNCFQYNVPGTPYNYAGIQLQRLFDKKWKDLPSHDDDMDVDDDSYVESDSDVEDNNWQPVPVASSSSKPTKASSKKKKTSTLRKLAASRKATTPRKSATRAPSPSIRMPSSMGQLVCAGCNSDHEGPTCPMYQCSSCKRGWHLCTSEQQTIPPTPR